MKYLSYFFLASLFVMFSCSKNNDILENKDFTSKDFPQTWKLIKMTGSIEGSESRGQEMAWQESYIFKSDGTFLKTRITAGESDSAFGSYIFENEHQNLLLEYDQINDIIGSCTPDNKEHLYFNKNNESLMSNWWACDGPGLFYERID